MAAPVAKGDELELDVESLASSPQVLIPLRDGSLALGTYQGVFFCEFDGPRDRKIYVTTL